jgi:hypothetical protein
VTTIHWWWKLGQIFFFGKKRFRFEKWWLNMDSFSSVVQKAWNAPCTASKSIDVWQFRIRTLRRMVRGWAMNETAKLHKTKVELTLEYNNLDIERECRNLSDPDLDRLHTVERDLDRFWALEEIKGRQRSRDRNVLEGDRNTAYFHVVANHRSRKKRF